MPSPDENFPHKNDRTFHQRCLSRARDEPTETPLAPAMLVETTPVYLEQSQLYTVSDNMFKFKPLYRCTITILTFTQVMMNIFHAAKLKYSSVSVSQITILFEIVFFCSDCLYSKECFILNLSFTKSPLAQLARCLALQVHGSWVSLCEML